MTSKRTQPRTQPQRSAAYTRSTAPRLAAIRSGPTDCGCDACTPLDGAVFDPLAEWARMQQLINRSGYCVQFVVGERGRFSWAYTIGRMRTGKPELLITGVSPESASAVLSEVVRHWDNRRIDPDGLCTLPGSHRHTCRFADVPDRVWDSEYLLGAARDAREHGCERQRSALQVLVPDATNIFPDDPAASAFTRKWQPIIGRLPLPR